MCTENISYLGQFCSYDDINLTIPNIPIGEYTLVVVFNGVQITQPIDITTANEVTIKNIFNENYTYTLYLTDTYGNAINNTGYSITIIPCVQPTCNQPCNKVNVINMTSVAGNVITNNAMINRNIAAIVIDDYTKNTGFAKNIGDDFLTFIDGTQLINGQRLTIFLA